VDIRPLGIEGAWVFTPRQFPDDRGLFLEWFTASALQSVTGHQLALAQANHSVSRRGTVRGIHYADLPPSQAKYVYCPAGAVMDVVVDIRTGSPTYGEWRAIRLDDTDRRGVYVAEGLGHAFVAVSAAASVTYLCSTPYSPEREHAITPLDPDLDIAWQELAGAPLEPLLSARDASAPTLSEAAAGGRLPAYDDCVAYYDLLRRSGQ
jgi:dTDP-4-dehydrorhamnose 3,5-epimerase